MLAGSVLRSARTAGNARSIVGRTAKVCFPPQWYFKIHSDSQSLQRSAASTSSGASIEAVQSPFRLTVAGCAATAATVGSVMWYYHLFGRNVYAMTPVEEGFGFVRDI